MKQQLTLTIMLAASVLMSGCDPQNEMQANHRLQIEREKHRAAERLAAINQQYQIEQIDRQGEWNLEQTKVKKEYEARKHKESMATLEGILWFFIPFGAGVGAWYIYSKKEAAIAFRQADLDEAKARYEAGIRALQLLPEEQRQPLLEKWVENNQPPQLGRRG